MRASTRRQLVAWLALGGLLPPALARDSALPTPSSLAEAARAAAARAEPLVILVSLPGCPYCELVRRNYLLPMRGEGLQAWQIDITDRRNSVQDFEGRRSSGAELARRWQASITPTVLFFDAAGREIAPRLTGVTSTDFYGSYLDESVAQARRRLATSR